MNRADAVARVWIQVLACAVCHVLVCQDLQIDGVNLRGVRVAIWIGFVQAVQAVWVVVGVTDPVEVLLVVLNVSGQVVIGDARGGEAGPVLVARRADAVEGQGQFEI